MKTQPSGSKRTKSFTAFRFVTPAANNLAYCASKNKKRKIAVFIRQNQRKLQNSSTMRDIVLFCFKGFCRQKVINNVKSE